MTNLLSTSPFRAGILGLAFLFSIPLTQASAAQVFFDGSSFLFTSTMDGVIGTTPAALYVWGIKRGAGAAGFLDIAPGVRFHYQRRRTAQCSSI